MADLTAAKDPTVKPPTPPPTVSRLDQFMMTILAANVQRTGISKNPHGGLQEMKRLAKLAIATLDDDSL